MSYFSETWHDLSPAMLTFYNNWATHHTNLLNRWWKDDPFFPHEYFNMIVGYWPRPLGRDVAYSQWMGHLAEWGYIKPDFVFWHDHGTWQWQGPMPSRGVINFPTWYDQFIDVIPNAVNYPRAKRKAPRSYWTGKPRHRRNI